MPGLRSATHRKACESEELAKLITQIIMHLTGDEAFAVEEKSGWFVYRYTGEDWVLV